MDILLARYLDGDLGDDEARAFQERLASDPALARELARIESALAFFATASCRRSPRAFAARVMESLPPAAAARPARAPGWQGWALAATVVLCLGLGWAAGRYAPGPGSPSPSLPVAAAPASAAAADLRWVRLVHMPLDPSVAQVSVAGDFNGWDPQATPMQRQGEVWVTWLALPADVYEYMFVENGGARWVTDPLALQTRADGFGGENAVLDLGL